MRVLIVFLIVLVLGFFLLGDAWSTDVRIPSQPVAVNSHNSFSKTIEKLKGAIKKRNLTIIFELDYEEIMGAAGIEGKNLVTIGFVGPEMEQELLRAEPKAALEIPLRIAVRELDNGAVDFVYYQPSYLMSHYQNRDLEKLKHKDGHSCRFDH
jgi:uncharacterized protein (DUF302 family)